MKVGNATARRSRAKITRAIRAPSRKGIVLGPVFPNAGVEVNYRARLDQLIAAMYRDARMTILPAAAETTPVIAQDAASPTKQLQTALDRWGKQWIKRFDLMSRNIADDFASRSTQATQTSMLAQLKKAGFTVAFKPTKASIEAYRVVAAENIALIKSIAQKAHNDVQALVWESVKRGGALKDLSAKLEDSYGVTRRRAALIARDQNAKAKAVIEAVRHQELGITHAIWMHSHAGKTPRPTHVKMNNKLYRLDRGMWDEDEKAWIHPGQLINCGCTMRPYIPGFEGAHPEWEIAQ